MAIDVKRLVDAIQKKEHAVTSSTSTQDMIDILKAAKKLQGSVINSYADSSYLPNPLTTNERIAYLEDTKVIRLNNGVWDDPTGGVEAAASWSYQGSSNGYMAGGQAPINNMIQYFSFTSDGNAVDAGDITQGRGYTSGQHSLTHGYIAAGGTGSPNNSNIIEKYSFSSIGNSTDVGDLTESKIMLVGYSIETHGYTAGGYAAPTSASNVIERWPFSADGNSVDVGDMHTGKRAGAENQSGTTGYFTGGYPSSSARQKFSFASGSENGADCGASRTASGWAAGGTSSTTHGYVHGGVTVNTIDKFAFAADDQTSTDVGDLLIARQYVEGCSSTTHGYAAGGHQSHTPNQSNIEKYSHSSDGNSTDVGDLGNGASAVYDPGGAAN